MLVGVPKEIKVHEYRVGLTPDSVREFVHHGHKVVVETGAGAGIANGVTHCSAMPAARPPRCGSGSGTLRQSQRITPSTNAIRRARRRRSSARVP